MNNVTLVHKTANDLMKERSQHDGDKRAFVCDGEMFTWRECDEMSDLLASKFLSRGFTRGMHLGIWSLNDISEFIVMIAAMKVGIIPAVINYSYKAYELENIVTRADLAGLLIGKQKCNTDYWQMACEVASHREKPLFLAGILEDFEEARRAVRTGYRLPAEEQERLEQAVAAVRPDDAACLVFTSGSTKDPKPVLLSFDNIVNDVRGFDARLGGVGPDDVILAPCPLFHCSGITGLMFHSIVSGAMGIIQPMFQADEALRDIQEYQVSILMLVPTMAEMMMAHKDFESYDLTSLRSSLFSGSEITAPSYRKMLRKFGLDCILNSYGQTECAPIITTTLADDDDAAASETIGVPLEHVRIRICDPTTDEPLPDGQIGEIQAKGFNTMIGYYNFPDEMARKYAADGWLKTSDAGWIDERGRLRFSCRIAETIIKGGENISPAEIEEVAMAFSDDIQSMKVVGVPSEKYGEDIACVLSASCKIDVEALQAYVRSHLASFKCPRYVFQVEDLPRTDTNKVSLRLIRELAEELAGLKESIPHEECA